MDGVLSQEEINALLNNPGASSDTAEGQLSDSEKDTIGEIANISMGTAATTLFSLVNRKVEISTPVVTMANWDDVVKAYERPCVFIRIGFTVGLDGSNILILKEHDVKVITDLMMGGDGTNTDVELGRTSKSIHDILDFAPGTIIELNKIAGEPIDVLVNGKYVAKGEVVVIEESFGVRITEIIK